MGADDFQKNIFDTHETKSHKELVDQIIENIVVHKVKNSSEKPRQTLLEVGCGGGQLFSSLTSSVEIYGIDVSEKSLDIARKRGYITSTCNIETDAFPFDSQKFDIVVVNDVLEHIIDVDHCIREIYRVLKNDGIFILGLPNVSQPVSWIMQIFLDLPPMMSARYKSPHIRDYTLRIMRIVLYINGFQAESVRGTYIYPFQNRISASIARFLPRLSERLIFVATKSHTPLPEPDIIFDLREFLGKFEGEASHKRGGLT